MLVHQPRGHPKPQRHDQGATVSPKAVANTRWRLSKEMKSVARSDFAAAICRISGNQEATIGVIAHPGLDGFSLALQKHQIRRHPLVEDALSPCFDVRPYDPAALPFPRGRLLFQLERGQQEPFPLSRRQGLDVLE